MDVRLGYKLTEVGVVPDSWRVDSFAVLYAEPSRNGLYKSAEYQGRGIRIVNMGEMFGIEFISDQEMSRIILNPKEIAIAGLSDGDLLFGRRSIVPAGAGKCSIVVHPSELLTFESSIIRVRLNQAKACPLFYYYFFASPAGRSLMNVIISGTNIKGIRGTELRELKVPRPALKEQRAIAAALSDVDALLGSLERLIVKKRDLKQATMQQLLTGQTRLPGFSGEWELKSIQDLGYVGRGRVISHIEIAKASSPDYPVYSSQTSNNGVMGYLDTYEFEGDYITWTTDGANAGTVFARSGRFNCTNVCGTIKLNNSDHRFIAAVLGQSTQHHVSRHLGNPKLMNDVMKRIEILIPKSIEEQTAIAAVLSDMDAEIAALEARRAKTRALKQGMMQELLTGKTRLV